MASNTKPVTLDRIISGISDYDKESMYVGSVSWLRSVDYRSDPRKIKILPKTTKESGTVYLDLPKWFTARGTTGYFYDASGNLYQRSSVGSHSLIRSVGNSHGNGLAYYGEDDFVYYTTDTTIGRYGQFSAGSPAFADDFLGSAGGVPTNTNSTDLESGSSDFMYKTDTAGLSITSDITMENYIDPESLPTVGNTMTLQSKWLENGNQRSYRFDILAISGYFGDGSDSSLTISADTTEAPIDSTASGTLDSNSLTATNASFVAGQIIWIHQSQGTGAGTWQRTRINSYTAGTIVTEDPLNFSYATGAQVRVLKQYTNVTINSGKTYTSKAWNGSVGGLIGFIASGTVTVTGTVTSSGTPGGQITALNSTGGRSSGGGFRGGNARKADPSSNLYGQQGECPTGDGSYANAASLGGGGGGKSSGSGGGGAGASHSGVGNDGTAVGSVAGVGSTTIYGSTDLTTMLFGSGGGGGGNDNNSTGETVGAGGNGGGIVFITAATLTVGGAITSNGGSGGDSNEHGGGGGASGGSILLKVQTATLGSAVITATGGTGGSSGGGDGSSGRIHLDYYTSYTGTTSPTLNATQDNNLVTTTSYSLRISISSTGTNVETLSKVATIATAEWKHVAVSWDASAATAEFMVNGSSIGTVTGSLTAIYNSTASYAVGAYYNGAGSATAFYDGKMDENRLWNVTKTASEIFASKDSELIGNEAGLVAYHQFDGNISDTTANANDLTHSGTPAYSSDVPFAAPTTRLDIDQQDTSTGATSATATSISEGASGRQTFIPNKDPQKSVKIFISDTGDNCDWTITIHDSLNHTIATKTLTNAQVVVGANEFTFSTPWTPILGASYHIHVTTSNTTGTPLVVSGSSNNFETMEFATYYQFLVTDTEWHPELHYGGILAIGNGRYLAVWDAASYNPHRLKFPSGHRVRCLSRYNEYIAIGCMLGSTTTEVDGGRIFFWDGTADTYNFFIDVPEGAINAMLGSGGQLDFIVGYQLDYMRYTGGGKAEKIKRLPKITNDNTAEVLPGGMAMWQGLMRIGVGDTTSSVVERGVYTYGRVNTQYPESLSYDYPISTGSRLSTVQVGAVATAGTKLLIGWEDGVAHGVDVVDPAGSPFSSATIEYLIRDEGGVWKEKDASFARVDYNTLSAGHGVIIKQKIDRATNWTTLATGASTNDDPTKLRSDIDGGRNREYQVAIDITTSISTSPEILGVSIHPNLLADEDFK